MEEDTNHHRCSKVSKRNGAVRLLLVITVRSTSEYMVVKLRAERDSYWAKQSCTERQFLRCFCWRALAQGNPMIAMMCRSMMGSEQRQKARICRWECPTLRECELCETFLGAVRLIYNSAQLCTKKKTKQSNYRRTPWLWAGIEPM